jgi:hypothetical protein
MKAQCELQSVGFEFLDCLQFDVTISHRRQFMALSDLRLRLISLIFWIQFCGRAFVVV